MKKGQIIVTAMLAFCATSLNAQQSVTPFNVIVNNLSNDDNKIYNDPHRSPAHGQPAVGGTYDVSTGTLCLRASFDMASVRIYKDNTLIMEDNYPVMDDATVYYNLSFYGSGSYRICIYDEDGNSYVAYMNI